MIPAREINQADHQEAGRPAAKDSPAGSISAQPSIDESGTSTAALGRLLGNSGLASQIVLGRRELSKAHIRTLSRHFKLDAGYFL
jgi:antitoxin component HigA of HigAB toxin-antitoxin module